MKELKKLQLNNKSLDEFDELMNYHLDTIEELEINEININAKLYNLISLCTNLKQLTIKGDIRSDVNKIFFNICNPENIETIILESVKLPTNKAVSKFTNISTMSLNHINFCDILGFFKRISNPEKVIALNLTNVDFGKRPISICSQFKNLKYLNLNSLKNCIFDSFEFIYENKKISRFEFSNNQIGFENINSLLKGTYHKKIVLEIPTSKHCHILNSLEIEDREITLTMNTCDFEKAIENVSLYRLTNLLVIWENNIDIDQYMKNFKKIKGKVTIAINDIAYFTIEEAQRVQKRLGVEFVNVLESPEPLKLNDKIQCYSVDEYILMRKKFNAVVEKIADEPNSLKQFEKFFDAIKSTIKYSNEKTDLKDFLLEKKSSHNYFAVVINSFLKELQFESKIIKGNIGEDEKLLWNQVKINDEWFNFDIAYELKENKKIGKDILLNDEEFYKTHTAYLSSKPEICTAIFQELKKEIKKENKISIWKKIYQKLMSIFKFNKGRALPEPEGNKEEK